MRNIFVFVALFACPVVTAAQEDIEPRVVGAVGVTTLGIGGFVDGFSSSEDTFPVRASVNVDVTRFMTTRIAVRGGVVGATTFRDDDAATGPGAAALDALVSGLFYFTPQSMLSLYAGGEYRAPLTRRADHDLGTALGLLGTEATVSSRASIFVQTGYGARLTRGDEGELQTRFTGQIGVRIKF